MGASCRLSVAPDVQVSRERTFYNPKKEEWSGSIREIQIAVNPRNPKNLLASGIYMPGDLAKPEHSNDQRSQYTVMYRSHDGGKSWAKVVLPEVMGHKSGDRGGDPVVVFNKNGDAYLEQDTTDNGKMVNTIFRSTDGGRNWAVIGTFPATDHIMWTGNTSADPADGRVYGLGIDAVPIEGGEPGRAEYKIILHKIDGENLTRREITNTTEIAELTKTKDNIGMNSVDFQMVSRSGKLFMVMHSWSNDSTVDNPKFELRKRWIITSDDRGQTNAKPRMLVKADGSDLLHGIGSSRPGFAIDNTTGPFANRLYTVFMDAPAKEGPWGLYLSHSDDEGRTWSDPVLIERQQLVSWQEDKNEAYPGVSVNNRGVVVIHWFRDRLGPDKKNWQGKMQPSVLSQRMATASLDGGKTFLPVVALSRKVAEQNSGDYIGIASGSDGRTHALWTDMRSGPGQMFHAATQVLCNGKPAAARP